MTQTQTILVEPQSIFGPNDSWHLTCANCEHG